MAEVVHGSPPYVILFMFSSFAVGAIIRVLLKKIRIPYTVVLLSIGCVIGLISSSSCCTKLGDYTRTLSHVDPLVLMHVFFPVLLYESAFTMNIHTFMQSFTQVLLLASIGVVISTALIGALAVSLFSAYEWTWTVGLLFGSILSATDPIAVVAVLKELGTSERLTILIEGEALLNDGSSIVLFNVITSLVQPKARFNALDVFISFIRTTLGGSLYGFLMGKLTVSCLNAIFNDAIIEVSVTLTAAYLTFYIGEEILRVSGVIAVVILGLVVNANRTSISPEVEEIMNQFWSTLVYLANTLIFVIVGLVITERAAAFIEYYDWIYLIALYFGIHAIRLVIIVILSPVLIRLGYGFTWKDGLVMTWSGLRGAVGLSLALVVIQNEAIPEETVVNKILVHTAGVVALTLLINATTIKVLLQILGMCDISYRRRVNMAYTIQLLMEQRERSVNILKIDRFLADAHWDLVQKSTIVKNPYIENIKEEDDSFLPVTIYSNSHFDCRQNVKRKPTDSEYREMWQEAKFRVIKAQKESYWSQYEHGLITKGSVEILVRAAEAAADKTDSFIDINELRKHWEIRGFYLFMKNKLEMMITDKSSKASEVISGKFRADIHVLVTANWFDITIYCIILLNLIPIIMTWTLSEQDSNYQEKRDVLKIINIIFFLLYVSEAILKITGLGFKNYVKDNWNKFDFLIIIISVVDIMVEIVIDSVSASSSSKMSLAVINFVKIIKLTRLGRLIRLFKPMVPEIIKLLNSKINDRLSAGYDIGRGLIVGEEITKRLIDRMVNDKKIIKSLKNDSNERKTMVMKELGTLQEKYPSVAMSVKTRQAIRSVLNKVRDMLNDLKERGQVDDTEHRTIELIVEYKMKNLRKTPSIIAPPSQESLLRSIPWIENNELLTEFLIKQSTLISYHEGETIAREGELSKGVYIILSGMVKIYGQNKPDNGPYDDSDGELPNTDSFMCLGQDSFDDFFSSGNVIGEMSLLTDKTRNSSAICETAVQTFFIPHHVMMRAILNFNDYPLLKSKIWRVCALRIAAIILTDHVEYQDWTDDNIKMYLEDSIMPDLRDMKTFSIGPGMSDVILIQGIAINVHTRELYKAPVYIPKTTKKLCFSETNVKKTKKSADPKLLVVPNDDFVPDHYDWIGTERWKRRRSTHCLLQASEHRLAFAAKKRKSSVINASINILQESGSNLLNALRGRRQSKVGSIHQNNWIQ